MPVKSRILIIDDEKNITSVLRAFLEATSAYEVATANSGQEGLDKARDFKPHLILLDVMMPDFGGDEFVSKMKKDPVLRAVPVVFLTGIVTKDEVRASGGAIGGYTYLAKPIASTEELTACIETNLRPRA